MAHSPSFGRSYSNRASRLAYERPWLLVAAALGVFACYIFSGQYSLTPLNVNDASSLAESSAASFNSRTGALTETGVVSAAANLQGEAVSAPQAPAIAAQTPALAALTQRWAASGIVLVTQGQAWDDASVANVDAALSLLPPAVLDRLGNPELGSLHVLVNAEGRSLNGSQPYGGPANYFSTNDGVNELVLYPGQRIETVLHELGHAYNLRNTPAGHYAQVLVDPEMETFLAATQWRVLTPRDVVAGSLDHTRVLFDYGGTFTWPELSHFDPLEDFANAFAMYYTDPEGLRAASLERHGWMDANLPR